MVLCGYGGVWWGGGVWCGEVRCGGYDEVWCGVRCDGVVWCGGVVGMMRYNRIAWWCEWGGIVSVMVC